MKTTITSYRFIKLALAAGLVLAGMPDARAAGIPIVNASFETPPVRPGVISQTGIPGWTQFSPLSPGDSLGVANLPANAFLPPSDGSQMAHVSTNSDLGVLQFVPAMLQADMIYILTVDCFFRNQDVKGALVELGAGAIGQWLGGEWCTPNHPHATVTSVTPSNPAHLGQPVLIGLCVCFGGVNEVFFDNVRLDAFPIPPALPVLHGAFCCGGISPEQTARLSAFCDGSVTPAPCNATLEFHDIHGVLLNQTHLNLRPGETGFLDQQPPDPDRPMEVIPKWFLNEGSANLSFEVSDTENLRTRFFVNWADGSVAKTGNLDSGPVSLTRGDTGRLEVYCDGSVRVEGTLRFASCQAGLAFHDTNGRLLKQSHLNLAPGTAGFLDLTFDETRSMDRRAVVIPSLNVTGGPAVGSLAVLDSATGITITQSSPAMLQTVGR
jgi:hypothetical protein